MLTIIEKCPVQYHAPVYAEVIKLGIPTLEVYGSDHSLKQFHDQEFGETISFGDGFYIGNECRFLSTSSTVGTTEDKINAAGIERILDEVDPLAALIAGYGTAFDRQVIQAVLHRKTTRLIFRAETTDHAVKRPLHKRIIRDFWLRRLYNRCDFLLYIGKRSLEHYQRLGAPNSKLIHSPYCVNPMPFRCSERDRTNVRLKTRKELRLNDDQLLILYSGKLSFRKGVDLLPQAVRMLSSDLKSRVVLGFMGDGAERGNIEQSCIGMTPVVDLRLMGFKKQEEMSDYYHAADVTVLPSRSGETWGLVVNESLQHGVRCIVSDAVGSSDDLIHPGKNGQIFPSESAAFLARCIEDTLCSKSTAEMREFCRQSAASHSVCAAANGIAVAYNKIASRQ